MLLCKQRLRVIAHCTLLTVPTIPRRCPFWQTSNSKCREEIQSQSFIKRSDFGQHLKVIRQNTSNILPQSQGQPQKKSETRSPKPAPIPAIHNKNNRVIFTERNLWLRILPLCKPSNNLATALRLETWRQKLD